MSQVEVRHNQQDTRFEAPVGETMAVLDYRMDEPGVIVLHETRVPPELEGRGIGSALAKTALNYAREQGLKVVPECSFVASYIQRKPEYADLVKQS